MKGTLKKSFISLFVFTLTIFGIKVLKADYFESGGIYIPLKNNETLFIGTEYSGHGHLFAPFEGLVIRKELSGSKKQPGYIKPQKLAKSNLLVKKFFAVLLVGKLNEVLKSNPTFFNWISNSELKPLKELIFKLTLLFKSSKAYNNPTLMIEEAFALLLRFAQSKIDFIDANKMLSDYLPDEIIEIFENLKISFLINFIDNAWQMFNGDFNIDDKTFLKQDDKVSLIGIVFDDKELAKKCFELLPENCTKEDFENKLWIKTEKDKRLIVNLNYEVWSYKNYLDFKGPIFNKCVGEKDFGQVLLNKEGQTIIPEEIMDAIIKVNKTSNNLFSKVLMVPISDSENWVIHVTNKIGFNNTITALFTSLLKMFKDYYQVVGNNVYKNQSTKNKSLLIQKRNRLQNEKVRLQKQLKEINEEVKKVNSIIKKTKNSFLLNTKSFIKNDYDSNLLVLKKSMREKLMQQAENVKKQIEQIDIKLNKIFINIFGGDFNIKQVIKNLNTQFPQFKKIRDEFLKRLELILKNSDHLEQYWWFCTSVVEELFPVLKDDLEHLNNTTNNNVVEVIVNNLFGIDWL